MRFEERVVIETVVLGLLVSFVGLAIGYPEQARLVPIVLGIPALILMGAVYVSQVVLRGKPRPDDPEQAEELRTRLHTELGFVMWIGWLVLTTYLLGFSVSIPLFLFPVLRYRFSQGLKTSVGMTVVAWATLYICFEVLLKVPLNCGVLLAH